VGGGGGRLLVAPILRKGSMTEQFIQILGRRKDGSIQFLDRAEVGLGHAFARTECVDIAEGVRSMGYVQAILEEKPRAFGKFDCLADWIVSVTMVAILILGLIMAWR
jgi:hypothetical protein